MEQEKIDWDKFEDKYVRLEPETEKTLVISKWRMGNYFSRIGISAQVGEEDGLPVCKQFTITSRRLISALKPILQRAEEENRELIRLSITRIGEGFDTSYEVAELLLAEEEVVPDE